MELEFARERELVHLRYELRRLLADGRREEAAPLLEQLRLIASQVAQGADGHGPGPKACGPALDSGRAMPIDSEIARWATTFNL